MAEFSQFPEDDIPELKSSGDGLPVEGVDGPEFRFSDVSGGDPDGATEDMGPSRYLRRLGEEADNPMMPSGGWAGDVEPPDFASGEVEESPTALDLCEEDRATLYDAIKELASGGPMIEDGFIQYHEWRMPSDLAARYNISYDVSLVCDPDDIPPSANREYGIEARKILGTEEKTKPDGSRAIYTSEQKNLVIFTRDVDVPEGVDAHVSVEEESSISVVGDDGREDVALTNRTVAVPLTLDEVLRIKDAVAEALRQRAEEVLEAPEIIPQELLAPELTVMDMPDQERDGALVALELFVQGGERYSESLENEKGEVIYSEQGFVRVVPAELLAEGGIEYDKVEVRVRLATPEDPYFMGLVAERKVPCYISFPVGEDGALERRVAEGTEAKIVNFFIPEPTDGRTSSAVAVDAVSELAADYPESLLAELSKEQLEASFVVGGDKVPLMTLEEIRKISRVIGRANGTTSGVS